MRKDEVLSSLNKFVPETLLETLKIEFIDADPENGMVKAEMPVTPRVHQPAGLLHGGASAALAESIGSAGSSMFSNPSEYHILGIELGCNHVGSVKEGKITGTGHILHKGRSTHLWEIRIEDERGKLISHCKLTNMIVPLKK